MLSFKSEITTLITLIIYRSAYDLLIQRYSNAIASAFPDIPSWDFIGAGSVLGIPTVALAYIFIAIFGHIFMTRLRPGWHITAIGAEYGPVSVTCWASASGTRPHAAAMRIVRRNGRFIEDLPACEDSDG